jgi:hypothetical protein
MKISRTLVFTCMLLGALSMSRLLLTEVHAQTGAAMTDGPVLTGELVASNAGRNQFRLVGHGGWYTAPVGVSLEALDGKPVQVQFARDGRVLQISEMPVRIEPITHSYETITGQLIVRDPVLRTFAFPGDSQTYVAPSWVDIRPYSGRMVQAQLDEQGRVTGLELAEHASGVSSMMSCAYDGRSYSDGAALCQSGIQYVCEYGQWRNLGRACKASDTNVSDRIHGAQPARFESRSCVVGGASVANGSSICRSGTTFRCIDGEWVNVSAACS